MVVRLRNVLAGCMALLAGISADASADPIHVDARFVDEAGAPIAGLPVRLVIGSERDSRAADAGRRLVTGTDGKVAYQVDAPVGSRRIPLDNVFVRHPSRLIEIGVEMDLIGHRALYWVEIDLVQAGPLAGMAVFVQDASGGFQRPLPYDQSRRAWHLPGQTMLMTGIGAQLRDHAMSGSDGEGWRVRLLIEKQTFAIR